MTTDLADLVDHVHRRTRTVIDAELRRLARRVPALGQADLDTVDAALEELAESLIIARLRRAGPDDVPLLEPLFATTKVVPRTRGSVDVTFGAVRSSDG